MSCLQEEGMSKKHPNTRMAHNRLASAKISIDTALHFLDCSDVDEEVYWKVFELRKGVIDAIDKIDNPEEETS